MELTSQIEIAVRFSEVDSLAIVWHGNYARYFEDGREAFGKKYKLNYMDIFNAGYVAPLVDLFFEYKKPLRYTDHALIITKFVNTKAAKIVFEYEIYNAATNELAATGRSTQVFLEASTSDLCIINPVFYENWKTKWGLLE